MAKPRWLDLADRLRWARAASGLSAYALSRRAGLGSVTHVALIENRDRKNIDIKTAQSIARALGLSWVWLLSGEGDIPTEKEIKSAVRGAA